MTSPLYRKIAVASTFSPRFEQVLAEARRARDRFGSELAVLFVGEKNEKTSRRFAQAFEAVGLPSDSPIYYATGSPAEAILKTIAAQRVELVIAGALEKEVVLRSFLGNVARRLVRDAKSSVLLFTQPAREPKPFTRIVFFAADFSEHSVYALKATYNLARAEKSECVHVIRVYTTFDAARASRRARSRAAATPARSGAPTALTLDEEEQALEEFAMRATPGEVPVEARCIQGNTGFAACDFVESIAADLLVVPAAGENKGLPAHVSWITDVIPCNLWVIRKGEAKA